MQIPNKREALVRLLLMQQEKRRRRILYEYKCEILSVVDGDTLDLDIDIGFGIHNITRVRLAHINAPEKSTQEGVVAREALVKKINSLIEAGDTFLCRTEKDKKEKYGRYLATIVSFKTLESLNNFMLENKYAVKYM